MKENRKLLKDVLDDIRQDMSDEEVLNLLADRKISVRPEATKRPPAPPKEPAVRVCWKRKRRVRRYRVRRRIF